jgi:hypothetical protein
MVLNANVNENGSCSRSRDAVDQAATVCALGVQARVSSRTCLA